MGSQITKLRSEEYRTKHGRAVGGEFEAGNGCDRVREAVGCTFKFESRRAVGGTFECGRAVRDEFGAESRHVRAREAVGHMFKHERAVGGVRAQEGGRRRI